MGETKFPVVDKDFYRKVLGECRDDEERGLVLVLILTGMHISVVSGATYYSKRKQEVVVRPPLNESNLIHQGSVWLLKWQRPKTEKTLQAVVPNDYVEAVRRFLLMKKKTRIHYYNMVRGIGKRAGYDDISPMTFRHQRCSNALDDGMRFDEVCHLLGCTVEVAVRNYSVKRDALRKSTLKL